MKLALLFLTVGKPHHAEAWERFIHENPVVVRSHVKGWEDVPPTHWIRILRVPGIETAWGNISLVRATLLMLESAFKDKDVTHFALVSESCMPVRDFNHLKKSLAADPRSRLPVENYDTMWCSHKSRHNQNTGNIPKEEWRFHPQWFILNREDAGLILQTDHTSSFQEVFAPDEHYFGTVLAMHGRNDFSHQYPTWTRWDNGCGAHPRTFHKTDTEIEENIIASGCFFARKFGKDYDSSRFPLPSPSENP